jgi:hypothetical protein
MRASSLQLSEYKSGEHFMQASRRKRPQSADHTESASSPAAPERHVRALSKSAIGLFQDFQCALARIQSGAQQRFEASNAKYADDLRAAQKDAFKPAREAYLEYLTAYQKFQVDPEETPAAKVYRAEFNYREAHQNAVVKAQRISEDCRQAYIRETRRIHDDVCAAWQAAFADYVRALQAALMNIDSDMIEAATLNAIGQSMTLAAMSAQSAGTGATLAIPSP